MRIFKNLTFITSVLGLVFFLTGCMAHTARLARPNNVYQLTRIDGAPKIILTDLRDTRADKKSIGQVSALILKSDVDINVALTDRIAAKLRDTGFNVQKVNLSSKPGTKKIVELLKSDNGILYVSGNLSKFFISSFDAVMEAAKGNTIFSIFVYDNTGAMLFSKTFTSHSENWIGITGGFGADKSIDIALESSIDELFKNREFKQIISENLKNN
ncbi:MAG: hypothetical protein KJ995_06825 [Candidatus Omnitrophica bacterium]|nr:hypothetical protein [Candidatus Omnitrophota bacterium]MBU1128496.1 hypothetical protein [Candidatus Omnitrophota bacterium]MBU1784857.1 hypothetical protein [Candidatus Omnitrophota bacterium]MBU1852096.1 hypothetical protein [Candidatus Omnitrophota bacterium]